MKVEETEMHVEHESATHDHGDIASLEIRVSVAHHYENGPASVGVYDVEFESRGDDHLHWAKITDAGDSDWFGATHCAVVLMAAEYVEDNYGLDVDTKQITSPEEQL